MFRFRDFFSRSYSKIALIALLAAWGESGCSTATSPPTAAVVPTLTGTNYPLLSVFPIGGIAVGSDRNLWFGTCPFGGMMKITTSGQISSYALSGGVTRCPQWVTLASDGAIWFTEIDVDHGGTLAQLGRIDVSGNITEFALPAGDEPIGITSGKDGNLWYDADNPSFNSNFFVRGFSATTHTIVGSLAVTLQSQVYDFSNSVVTNPADGNIIVSGGNPVFRLIPGTNPTIAGNIALPANCGTASIGADANFYFQCPNSVFARVSQTSYSVTTVSERLPFKGEATYSGPMFQGSSGILYTSGGYSLENGPFTGILALASGGAVTGYYPSDMHDHAVQGVAGPDGATWITIQNDEGQDAVLTRINP